MLVIFRVFDRFFFFVAMTCYSISQLGRLIATPFSPTGVQSEFATAASRLSNRGQRHYFKSASGLLNP